MRRETATILASAVDAAAAATKNVMCLHMVQTDCVHQAGAVFSSVAKKNSNESY